MINQVDQKEVIKEIENVSVNTPAGFFAGGLHCGIKRKRLDLGWLYSVVPANAAAVYTTNLFQAAPLTVTKESINLSNKIQGVIVNSGSANACTGEEGYQNAIAMRKAFAEQLQINELDVAVSSTGVIGEQLPMENIQSGIKAITNIEEQNNASDFEQAILTTDTVKKSAGVQLTIQGKTVTIAGSAKGSGMIQPNMATMLGFITTDANVEQESLQLALRQAVNETFNMITVDGDTSTNDMVLFLANGMAGNEELTNNSPDWITFLAGLKTVCQKLAKLIAKDGEGATKLIEVEVKGTKTREDAAKIAKSIIGSNLVKAAVFGSDPNWGRIVAAVGYSGVQLESTEIDVYIGKIQVVNKGLGAPFSETEAKTYLEENDVIQIFVDLSEGDGKATAWGCDLTYDYVKINASYRT